MKLQTSCEMERIIILQLLVLFIPQTIFYRLMGVRGKMEHKTKQTKINKCIIMTCYRLVKKEMMLLTFYYHVQSISLQYLHAACSIRARGNVCCRFQNQGEKRKKVSDIAPPLITFGVVFQTYSCTQLTGNYENFRMYFFNHFTPKNDNVIRAQGFIVSKRE